MQLKISKEINNIRQGDRMDFETLRVHKERALHKNNYPDSRIGRPVKSRLVALPSFHM